jgi:hypothetical protein
MSATAVLAPEQSGRTSAPEVLHPVRRRAPQRTRTGGGPGRRLGPGSLSPKPVGEGEARLRAARPARACSVEPRSVAASLPCDVAARVRLTERGIAVILTTGVIIVVAALTVLCLTALRVTGESAEPLTASYGAQL